MLRVRRRSGESGVYRVPVACPLAHAFRRRRSRFRFLRIVVLRLGVPWVNLRDHIPDFHAPTATPPVPPPERRATAGRASR
ncbi:hypothetical protein TNCV_4115841 [Trichonephila clavipes]|nr:hypothetical protein TNCV_4115841 [Trichonephila clavipes]